LINETKIDKGKAEFRIRKCLEQGEIYLINGKIKLDQNTINLGHILSLKGKKAEDFVYELAKNTFLTDWCYPNPKLPKPNNKEICDLLIVYDDIMIIWQIKDLKLDENNRYNETEVHRNMEQLLTAKNRLLKLKIPIYLENPRRGKELFDATKIKQIYLISALLGKGEDYFVFMDTIKGSIIHTFTRNFTEIILKELDTINDFVNYLKEKECITSEKVVLNGDEEELLAYYLSNERKFDSLKKYNMVVIDEGMWNDIQKKPEYVAKNKENEISYGWDEIIDRAHESKSKEYEYIARELARPNRFERRTLAKAFFEAHVKAHEDIHNVYRRCVPTDNCTYCFLFVNKNVDRTIRQNMLSATCFVARGLHKNIQKVIGIATEMKLEPTCSYDYCLIDIPKWDDKNQKDMEEIQKKTGIFTNITKKVVHEDEYPINQNKDKI